MLAGLWLGMLLIAAGCGSHESTGTSGRLETISSVEQFARDFDADAGHARIVLLLSPT
jgi:hypothetical protein